MGTYEHAIDAKGRVFMPAKFREAMSQCVITFSLYEDDCLCIYPQEKFNALFDKLNDKVVFMDENVEDLKRFYFGNSEALNLDSQGRFLVSQDYRELANLNKEISIIGADDHLEVWDREVWRQKRIERRKIARERLRNLKTTGMI